MDSRVERALAAMETAEAVAKAMPRAVIDTDHCHLIALAIALPENQHGADKGWLWPTYEYCRRHFASAHQK